MICKLLFWPVLYGADSGSVNEPLTPPRALRWQQASAPERTVFTWTAPEFWGGAPGSYQTEHAFLNRDTDTPSYSGSRATVTTTTQSINDDASNNYIVFRVRAVNAAGTTSGWIHSGVLDYGGGRSSREFGRGYGSSYE